MRNTVWVGFWIVAIASCAVIGGCSSTPADGASQQAGGQGGPGGARPGGARGGGQPGGGRGRGFRPPMTVEVGRATKGDISAELNVVGSLIGAVTVDVVPKAGGRLVSVNVKLGDRVTRGQVLAKIEDQEINEQVKQAEASQAVALATIRQREADLKFADINLDRSKSLFERQLLPRQALDEAEARQAASAAQVDLSRAQLGQTEARLEELRITQANTNIVSPVNGFVGKRNVDPGAWSTAQTPVVSVVDISSVRLVANVVERDLRLVNTGDPARVEVDAYPGETFSGRIARVAPVLDPATRTAEIEIEVPNRDYRLKPGMYALMNVTIESRRGATLVPKSAVVDYQDKRGVFTMTADNKAKFMPLETGIEDRTRVEVRAGLTDADTLVTNGASALRDNDTLVLAGELDRGGPPGGDRRGPGGPRGASRGAAAAEPGAGDANPVVSPATQKTGPPPSQPAAGGGGRGTTSGEGGGPPSAVPGRPRPGGRSGQ